MKKLYFKLREDLRSYLELCKIKISLFSTLSSAAGFFLASPGFGTVIFILIPGVFMLACGSSGLNQYQERITDARMERTGNRPIPSGKISPIKALYFSLLLIIPGLITLCFTGSFFALLLGLLALLWYNGVYTYLKRKTAFAVIPGALIGAIPPAIGWSAGGGSLKDPGLAALCFFFFMWQVPHFWILLLNHGKEYEEAGLPSLSRIFSRSQMQRITSHWIFATVVGCLFIFFFGLVHSHLTIFLLLAASLLFVRQGIRLRNRSAENRADCCMVFKKSNYYMLSVLLLLSLDRLSVFLR